MSLNNQTRKLVLLGGGNMGRAMLQGWLEMDYPPEFITVIDPSPSQELTQLRAQYSFELIENLDQLAKKADCLVVAVKPQIAQKALANAESFLVSQSVVLSVAAGKTIDFFKSLCAPAKIIRTIPNTPCLIGKGAIGACSEQGISQEQKEYCDALLRSIGKTFWVEEESQIDAITALSGSGPAYIFHLCEAMATAGQTLGLDAQMSAQLARQTIIGSAALMAQSEEEASELRENVTSPGGTTQAALNVLMGVDETTSHNLTELMSAALNAANKRSLELAKS